VKPLPRRHPGRTFLRHLMTVIQENELGLLATSMAFTTVLSVIPLVAVSVSIFLFVEPLEPYLQQLESIILQYLLSGPGNELVTQVRDAIRQMRSSVLGGAGLILLVPLAMKLLSDIDTAVQRVWGSRGRQRGVRSFLSYIGILVLGPVALSLLIAALSVDVLPVFGRIPTRIIAYLILTLILFLVYQFVPRYHVRYRASLISSVSAVLLLGLVQYGYAWLTANVINYNRIYGSLAVIPLFLIWVLIFWIVFLLGAAACATVTQGLGRRNGSANEQ
jgi:membrane protein